MTVSTVNWHELYVMPVSTVNWHQLYAEQIGKCTNRTRTSGTITSKIIGWASDRQRTGPQIKQVFSVAQSRRWQPLAIVRVTFSPFASQGDRHSSTRQIRCYSQTVLTRLAAGRVIGWVPWVCKESRCLKPERGTHRTRGSLYRLTASAGPSGGIHSSQLREIRLTPRCRRDLRLLECYAAYVGL